MSKIQKKNIVISNNDLPIMFAPLMDKASVVVDLPDAKHCGIAFSGMLEWLENHEPGVTKGIAKGKYHLAVNVHYPDNNGVIHVNGPSLRLEITNPKSANRQLRAEWNPAHMTEAGEDHIDVMTQSIIGVTFYEMLYHARFTRVDVCLIIAKRDIEDYLFRSKYFKFSQCFFGADGKLQTLNFGKSKYNQIIIYNKAKELYGACAEQAMIRVETRNRINLKANGLARLANPFERVQIYSLACKNPPFGMAHWLAFQDSCRLRGVSNAIKHQPVAYRSKLKKTLSQQPVTWWGFDDNVWEVLYQAAFENAGLCNIPNYAPPLSLSYHSGQAA